MKYVPVLLILPLVSAFLAPASGLVNKRFGKFFNLFIYGGGLIFSLILLTREFYTSGLIVIGGWKPPFGINLYFSPLSNLGMSLIYLLAFFIHLTDIKNDRKAYYNLLFSLFVFSSIGMILTGDLFNLFIFIEIASISVTILGSAGSFRAGSRGGVKYMVPSNLVAMFMLIGIALLYSALGTLNIAHIASGDLLNGAFATVIAIAIFTSLLFDAELFPFNTWVPDVYKGASSTFSAAISGIGGLSAAFVLGRVFLTMMGEKTSFGFASGKIASLLTVVGMASVLIGELSALRERDIKKVLAFSSVGQMGLVAIAFSTQSLDAVIAGIILLINHSLAKPLMLIVGGHFIKTTGETRWDRMRGVARSYPLMGILFILSALSLMGMPFFMGFWGKIELIKVLIEGSILLKFALGAILFAVIIEGVYFVRMSHAFFEQPDVPDVVVNKNVGRFGVVVSIVVFAGVILIFGILPNFLHGITGAIGEDLINTTEYIKNILQSVTSAGV